jgi:hypothetical protein
VRDLALLDSSGREIEGFYDARVRNLRAIVQLANILLGRRLEKAHAPRLSGHERAADVAYRPALRGHVLLPVWMAAFWAPASWSIVISAHSH